MQTQTTRQDALAAEFSALIEGKPQPHRQDVFARLRKELPIFRSDRLDAWVVTRYDDVKTVLSRDEEFQPPQAGAGASAFGRSFMQMGGREHSKKIGIVGREIRSQRSLRERLSDVVLEIARQQANGLRLGEPMDLREHYAVWVPLLSITALTDLPEAARFRDWYRTIVAGSSSSITNPGARVAAFQAREEVRLFLEPIIAERHRNPGKDLLSDLVTAEYEGEPIPHEEIVSNIIFLLAAGVETTERVLTSVLRHVAMDPAEWQWLKTHYTDPESLAAFCAEALRFYPPVNANIRSVIAEFEIAGVTVRPGEKICAMSVSGNHDDSHFPDAARFDHNRFMGASDRQFTSRGDILTFGGGIHHCVGVRLAKTEMEHALAEFLARVERIETIGSPPPAEGFIFHSPLKLPVILH
ncbi:MAG: cytochrome P450 [Rhodoferax sp.]|nr:cytochrome P450 [Rhodoferax sp.]